MYTTCFICFFCQMGQQRKYEILNVLEFTRYGLETFRGLLAVMKLSWSFQFYFTAIEKECPSLSAQQKERLNYSAKEPYVYHSLIMSLKCKTFDMSLLIQSMSRAWCALFNYVINFLMTLVYIKVNCPSFSGYCYLWAFRRKPTVHRYYSPPFRRIRQWRWDLVFYSTLWLNYLM